MGLLIGSLAFGGISSATDSVETFKWAYDQWIFYFTSGLLWSSHLRRQEFAPILHSYISKVAKKDYTDRWCDAKDLYKADSKYQEDLKALCGYGILRGEKNNLLPTRYLSTAHAVTLIMRVVDGYQKEATGGKHRATPYFERAKALGYEGILPIYYRKTMPITLEQLVNFLYSVEYPHQEIPTTTTSQWTTFQSTSSKSSDDVLRKLAEIMAK